MPVVADFTTFSVVRLVDRYRVTCAAVRSDHTVIHIKIAVHRELVARGYAEVAEALHTEHLVALAINGHVATHHDRDLLERARRVIRVTLAELSTVVDETQ